MIYFLAAITRMSNALILTMLFLLVLNNAVLAQSKKEQITVLIAERDSIAAVLLLCEQNRKELHEALGKANLSLGDAQLQISKLEREAGEASKSIQSLNDSVSAGQKRFASVRASAKSFADSLVATQLRYQAVQVSEAKANEGNKKLSMELQALSKAQADSISAGQARYRSAVAAREKAEGELRMYKQQLDSLRAASSTPAKATNGTSKLNESLRGEWEKFRDGILAMLDASKPEALELAFLNLEEIHHEELTGEIYYRTSLINDMGDNMFEPNTFERTVGFQNKEYLEIQTNMGYMMPSGSLGASTSCMLLDRSTGEMVTWPELILEGHEEAVSALFTKKARVLLPEITECVGDREMANSLISDLTDFNSLSYSNGSLLYSINADSDGVSACGWDVSVSLNELRSHLSPRIFK
jgi:hypothetical protein